MEPAVPNGVAVFVGATQVGRLPADLEAAYCPPLAQLTSRGSAGHRRGRPVGAGRRYGSAARVTVDLPEVSALA